MAPRKGDKKEEEKKKAKPKPKTTTPKATLRAKGYVAYTAKGFRGELVDRGRYVKCQLPVRRVDLNQPNHRICGATIQNEKRPIQSHYRQAHEVDSARDRDTKKDASRPWTCPCGADHENWTSHLQHIRKVHGVRGVTKAIREAGGLLKSGARLDPKTGLVKAKEEEEEEEDDDEGLFVPPHQDGPRDPKFDDDDHDGGFGPSGAAGGLIEAAA
ncbi:hypothetical protein PG997_005645 [Apiospora hydei]|uniref:Uncharacterized protein n=1 Tax=Apiospora hydei TaxID=1337664 RepID=A0ABR1WLK3_9PEZI